MSRNDSGITQIDQDYMNLSHQQSWAVNSITAGSFYTMAGFGTPADSNMIYFIVDYWQDNSVIAVRNNSGRAIAPVSLINELNSMNPPPGGYKRAVFYQEGSTPDTLYVYRFGTTPQSAPGGYGMVVRNGGNTIVFRNDVPVIRVRNLVHLQGGNVGGLYGTYADYTHAFLFCNPTKGNYYPASGGTRRFKQVGMRQANASTVELVGMNNYDIFAIGAGGMIDNPSIGAIINVSNL